MTLAERLADRLTAWRCTHWFQRLAALVDPSAWSLIIPALIISYIADPLSLKTVLLWSVQYLLFVGVFGIIVGRILFPMIRLRLLVQDARQGNVGSAIIAGCTVLAVALLILGGVSWSK